jgi:hypothetical protein
MGERRVGVSLDQTANEAVSDVRRAEQRDLAQNVYPSLRQDAPLQNTNAGDHRREA